MTVRLETERLVVTIASPDDAPRLLRYAEENNEHHAPWGSDRPPDFFTLAFWRGRQERAREEYQRDRALKLTVFRRDDLEGAVVGQCNFTDFVRGPVQLCQLGYTLDRASVGKGYMTEALRAAIAFVFEGLRFHRVRATYSPLNERSARVLRRLGFVVEGYARDYLFANGAWHDQVITGLVNPRGRGPETLTNRS